MNFSITITGDRSLILKLAAFLEGEGSDTTETVSKAPAAKRGPKPKPPQLVKEEPEEEELDFDDQDTVEVEDEIEEAPAPKKGAKSDAAKALTLDDDVLPAFKSYVKEHGREEAKAILKKFKYATTRDIKEPDFAKIIKALRA